MLGADHAAGIAQRVGEGLSEHLLGNLAAQGFEDLQLGFIRQPGGGHFRVFEVAAGAGVGAVEQLFIGPFEVQQQAQGLTHPHVLEQRPAQVKDKALHAGGVAVDDLFLDQSTFTDRRDVVGVGPVFRGNFQPVIELASLEGFQGDGVVAEIVGAHHIEVVETAIDRQVLAPVVLDPLVTDRTSGLDLADLVRPAAQRRFEIALGEVAVFPPVLGQHGQLTDDQRQLAIVVVLEGEQHPQWVFGDHLVDIAVVAAIQRCATFHQGLEAEHHVLGTDRMAVMEACLRAQVVAHPAIVRGFLDLAGDQPVFGEGFVQALPRQGVVDQVGVVGRYAFADEGVEAVEAAEAGLAEGPAFGRIRIDVIEVFEIRRVLGRFVVQGQGVLRRRLGDTGYTREEQAEEGTHRHH